MATSLPIPGSLDSRLPGLDWTLLAFTNRFFETRSFRFEDSLKEKLSDVKSNAYGTD